MRKKKRDSGKRDTVYETNTPTGGESGFEREGERLLVNLEQSCVWMSRGAGSTFGSIRTHIRPPTQADEEKQPRTMDTDCIGWPFEVTRPPAYCLSRHHGQFYKCWIHLFA